MNNKGSIYILLITITSVISVFAVIPAKADPACETAWDPVNQVWVTICQDNDGGGSGGGGNGSGVGSGSGCTPGETIVSTVIMGAGGLCEVWQVWHDSCTGQVSYANLVNVIEGGSCSVVDQGSKGNPENPCIILTIARDGAYCQTEWGIDWNLEARVGFPAAFLDLRPYPVTLVGWPSAARNGGTRSSSGSGSLEYIPYGGGEPDEPELGDWRDITLSLRLDPAAPIMFFSIPTIGTLSLVDVGPFGPATIFHFNKPSHPFAGADIYAGEIGLEELPPDLPVFSGSAVTAYRLFWSLQYEEYDRDCRPGPDPESGRYVCRTSNQTDVDNGHWEYEWERRRLGGEITPQMVADLPPSMAADLDGNGSADAYWNRKIIIRRMNNAGNVHTGGWTGSWSWGGSVYWAVREGQGQIGWPR